MYISPEDSALLIAASNLAAAFSARHGLDQAGMARETVNIFKMLKKELEKDPG